MMYEQMVQPGSLWLLLMLLLHCDLLLVVQVLWMWWWLTSHDESVQKNCWAQLPLHKTRPPEDTGHWGNRHLHHINVQHLLVWGSTDVNMHPV